MNGTIDSHEDYVLSLAKRQNRNWPQIVTSGQSAVEVQHAIRESLTAALGGYSDGDVDVVVFGSLARREWTTGSDVDWTLLIDGQASPEHRKTARAIDHQLMATKYRGRNLTKPGITGVFGNMTFGHNVIHHIGGQSDSNHNTTQRILLLLEAAPIRHSGCLDENGPYERIIKEVLFRYLQDDSNFALDQNAESRIPRFLLNDIVRFWRTMCVDFAFKEWEQAGAKWGLRNIKLRMSRKLIFVSALLIVFSCDCNPSLSVSKAEYISALQQHLMRFATSTPLNIIASVLSAVGLDEKAAQLLDCYEQFLVRIDNDGDRKYLEDLQPKTAYSDPVFLELREISHHFQKVLTDLFYAAESPLQKFIIDYGVF